MNIYIYICFVVDESLDKVITSLGKALYNKKTLGKVIKTLGKIITRVGKVIIKDWARFKQTTLGKVIKRLGKVITKHPRPRV